MEFNEEQDRPPPPLASTKVLETYELLERVLLHLPLRTLLLSRRVNTSFERVAKRSKSIRQALFLEASSEGPIVANLDHFRFSSSFHGVPQPPCFDRRGISTEWQLEQSKEVVIPLLNPFFAA